MKSQKPTREPKKEICFNCKHTRRWHKGSCVQPTCMCNCFEESGVFYGMDLFEAKKQGQLSSQNKLSNYIKERIANLKFQINHLRDENTKYQFYARISELKRLQGDKT
jgi:hypothetical protein